VGKITKMEKKERFIELRAKEMPYEHISKELEVSKPTLIKWGKELHLDINNRKALELELLQEKYYVSKKKRIELYGEQLERFNEEISKRDLSEVSTEKLIDMQMKVIANLKQEEIPLIVKEEKDLIETMDNWKSVS
jgi:hypothetical protein